MNQERKRNFTAINSSKSLSTFLENKRKLETDKTEFALQKTTLFMMPENSHALISEEDNSAIVA